MKVLVTEFMDRDALKLFGADAMVIYEPSLANDRAKLLTQIEGASAVIVRNKTKVDRELLRHAPNLKVVGRLGVGLDNIDVDACRDSGVDVRPATGANAISVAEYVICAAMTLVRGAFHSTEAVIAGGWPRDNLARGGELCGRTLGLFGFGLIAQTVVPRAKALGMSVAAFDPFLPPDHPAWQNVEACDAENLISDSDVLSLHVPLTPDTRNLIGASEIDRMKAGAVLINTSRGGIVDEIAVAAALKDGRLGGAALDVFHSEPLPAAEAAIFADIRNLILTPHISGVTKEANIRVSDVTVRNVSASLIIETSNQTGV
ncbi:hydroxyacid dehydrogenase [uncultured Ruegeria sp.]|uniref:hydroxyacid dehydrogenase n=1 Tax=uncultured Ruegeria sp. TaxID=259304 RepID=UPI0026188C06|nr:hydroxyacid dehydrogenase [uncultured Ruegeria sp.]